MIRSRSRLVRLSCLILLLAGLVIRPVLFVACEIHAANFDHAGTPHQHEHADSGLAGTDGTDSADTGSDDTGSADIATELDGHGDHDPLQLFAVLGLAHEAVSKRVLFVDIGAIKLPAFEPLGRLSHRTGAPFRPPIV